MNATTLITANDVSWAIEYAQETVGIIQSELDDIARHGIDAKHLAYITGLAVREADLLTATAAQVRAAVAAD